MQKKNHNPINNPDLSVCSSQSDDGECVPEAHVVMQMTVDDIITLIHHYVQVCAELCAGV